MEILNAAISFSNIVFLPLMAFLQMFFALCSINKILGT